MSIYIEPNLKSSAAITIDVQCDTLDGQPMEIPGTSAILPQIKMVLDCFRQSKMPIVHIVRMYKKDGSNVDLCRKEAVENGSEILAEGTAGCALAAEMFNAEVNLDSNILLSGGIQKIGANEVVIYKPRWGAFYQTPLKSHLDGLGVDSLVFMGCNYPNCPRTSIYEASERDFKIIMVEDAISGLYARGKDEMSNIGVRLMKSEHITKEIFA